jgi:FkbM family methyltransferase
VETIDVKLRGGHKRAFRHRGTRADQGVVAQIFKAQDYAFGRLRRGPELQGVYDAIVGSGRSPLVLDAGANIGASVVYFALVFPQAHIVALEPAADNFELLEANASGLDVDARRAAIGSTPGVTTLVDPGEGAWGYRTVAGAEGERVPVVGASALVAEKLAQGYEPFVAKIDIEGGEAELFSRDTDWVERFPLLIIELHDWLLPRGRTSHAFLRCIAALDRDFVQLGENVFSIANE